METQHTSTFESVQLNTVSTNNQKSITAICCLALLFLSTYWHNANAAWVDITPTTLPIGEQVIRLYIDPNNPTNLYATTTSAAVFKSTDSGTNWSLINTTSGLPVTDLAFDPITSDTIYAAFATTDPLTADRTGAIYISQDGGITWADMNANLPIWSSKLGKLNSLVIHPSTSSTMYVGNKGGFIYKSINSGTSWSTILTGDSFGSFYVRDGYNLAIDPFTPTTIYAADTKDNYLVKSIDGGVNWNYLFWTYGPGFLFDQINPNIFYVFGDNIQKTTDGGGSWSQLYALSTISLALHPLDSNRLYISRFGGLYQSTDAGINWNILDSTLSGKLVVDSSGTLFVISSDKIYKEADTDGDGVGDIIDINDDNDSYEDTVDNCILVANDQTDTDGDNYGNACDSDFNNDGIVNSQDIGLFKNNFFTTGAQQTDLNNDSIVNSLDLGLFKQRIFTAPGPSGLMP